VHFKQSLVNRTYYFLRIEESVGVEAPKDEEAAAPPLLPAPPATVPEPSGFCIECTIPGPYTGEEEEKEEEAAAEEEEEEATAAAPPLPVPATPGPPTPPTPPT
jgi:hypothetical protein